MCRNIFLAILLIVCSVSSYAGDRFVMRGVKILGLQGISKDSVLSYLPVHKGAYVDEKLSGKILQSLYGSGFFDDVQLFRKGNTLVIKVKQRPIISSIDINGNEQIPTDKLLEALKKLGFNTGSVFDKAILKKIKSSLSSEYFNLSKYNARIDIKVISQSRHRVAISINISEGKATKIRDIKIIGNHIFAEKTLLKQLHLSASSWFSFLSQSDKYSPEKLNKDLQSLSNYYLNRGYINFHILSSQVLLTPDRKQLHIVIHVQEGDRYKISGHAFKGKSIFGYKKLASLAHLKTGEIFSRDVLIVANKNIIRELGNNGYANARVDIKPKINEKTKTVYLIVQIIPGKRIYVRHINFEDNYHTNDKVLRRSMLQLEGALLQTDKVEESKHSLLLLGYIRDAQTKIKPVPGHPDQVDLTYKLIEQPSAQLKAGIGYSQVDHLLITASIDQQNVFGTGNSMSFNISHSLPSTSVNLSYYNPYYTESGIGRSFNIYTTHFDSSAANITDYATNTYGLSVGYNLPITLRDSLQFGYGFESDSLNIGSTPSDSLKQFVSNYGKHFKQLQFKAGWTHQGFDRSIFPTKGWYQSLSAVITAPVNCDSLEYYKLSYGTTYYHPIYKKFTGKLRFNFGYGNGYGIYNNELPFFKNYYAGGIGSVRGYEGNTLGPKDSNGNPLGGNVKLDGTIGLVFPNPMGENVRTTWFFDYGTVADNFHLHLRTAAGVELDWLTPVGLLNFSFAEAINSKPKDTTEHFQFNIGAAF